MTNKILLDKLQDCISFYKKNPDSPDLKEIFFSRLEFLDHQEFFEANVLYVGTLPQERLFNRISARYSARYASASFSPDEVWQQILDRKLVATDDIINALFPDAKAPGFYVQLLLFHPEDSDIHSLLFALQALFPLDAIVLRRYDSQLFHFPLPAGIKNWLAAHRCLLCVGNATRDLSMLRTNAALLAQTCRLGLHLRRPGQRLLTLEEYQMFILIDNSVKEFIRRNGHSDICYLAHPAVIHIARYDDSHKTNLMDVLYHNLIDSGNIQRTADALYMHRNTVLNKLKKIQELIHLDLSDGLLCQRLLLSCQLVEYQKKALKQSLNLERTYDESSFY